VRRLHAVIEKSPFEIRPGQNAVPIAAVGAVQHAAGVDMQVFYDQAREALKAAECGLDASDPAERVLVVHNKAKIDPEIESLMAG
jgi:hypothetical protein